MTRLTTTGRTDASTLAIAAIGAGSVKNAVIVRKTMKKQVRHTKAGESIAAFLVFKECTEVACIQAYYADSGGVWVDVYTNNMLSHQGRAAGWGYDKFTAALEGAVINGIKLEDHPGPKGDDGRYHAGLSQLENNGLTVIKAI